MFTFDPDCRVTIADDNMSAKLYLAPPAGGVYLVEDLVDFLRHNGVIGGIKYSVLEAIVKSGLYYRDMEVATGVEPSHGVNGEYEFFFNQEKHKKPLIRSDGSVDYQSMSMIHNIHKGDKLAVYHPANPGKHGIDVRGREIRAKAGKELPKLNGTGFDAVEDGNTYIANMEGKVEYDNYKLFVKDVYEHKGDLDLVVGRIDFRGDVIIHGNVCSGTFIRASRSITVEGSVEGATLISGGDIVLKKGMHGGKRAKITCGGDLYANFIEFTTVEAKGNVEANIIMNSNISAKKLIVVSGKRGALIGGEAYAVAGIRSSFVGNSIGVKTKVAAGENKEVTMRYHLLLKKAQSAKEGIAKTIYDIQRLKDTRFVSDEKAVREAKLSQLNRKKIRDERMIEHLEEEIAEIEESIGMSRNAVIDVLNTAFRETSVQIHQKSKILESDYKGTEFFYNHTAENIDTRPYSG